MTRPVGYVIARDLGDGRLEPYEGDEHDMPLYDDPRTAAAVRRQHSADPDTWLIYGLVAVAEPL